MHTNGLRVSRAVFIVLIFFLAIDSSLAAEIATVKRELQKWEQKKYSARSVSLKPVLRLPVGSGPFPLVVIVNSSSGSRDVFLDQFPRALNAAGIAAVSLDTFTPRGIRTTVTDQSKVSTFSMGLDALVVGQHYQEDPRIDPQRIAVSGHSKGGAATAYLANAQFYKHLRAQRVFAAGVAFSPSCLVQYPSSDTAFTMHALMGEKDDYTPPRFCIPLFQRMHGNPHHISFEVIPGTYHSWSTDSPSLRFIQAIQNVSRGPCASEMPYLLVKGERFLKSAVIDRTLSITDFITQCMGGSGATVGGQRENLALVFRKAVTWLNAMGW